MQCHNGKVGVDVVDVPRLTCKSDTSLGLYFAVCRARPCASALQTGTKCNVVLRCVQQQLCESGVHSCVRGMGFYPIQPIGFETQASASCSREPKPAKVPSQGSSARGARSPSSGANGMNTQRDTRRSLSCMIFCLDACRAFERADASILALRNKDLS